MDNWHKILGGIALSALIYIVFMQGCQRQGGNSVIIEVDTVLNETVIDTNWFDTTRYKYITVNIPKYYYDTVSISVDNFDNQDDFYVEYASIYEDTIKNDTISLYYRAKVWGFMEELKLGYKIFTPYSIEKTTTIQTEIVKKKAFQGFYLGMDIGIGKDGLTHVAPMLEVSTAKTNYNAGFDLNDKSVIIGARFKLGK